MCAEHDLGTIVRSRGASFLRSRSTNTAQRKALRAIAACRTPALGGQRQQCVACGYEHIQWHSCRSRSCPRCQGLARAAWVEARQSELLPVPYFHVVFTVPEQLNVVAKRAPRLFYDLLFRAASGALMEIAQSRLHVRIGALAVLHTWTQTLLLHPHVHFVVPGGGFSTNHGRWAGVRKRSFFLPVRVLSRRFRTLLCDFLSNAPLASVIDPAQLRLLLARVRSMEWVVYAKPPFGGPAQVVRYLAAYTHRIAISNSRIVAFDGNAVAFRYRHAPGSHRTMRLDVHEFLRRFLLHVVPRHFVRIRYYGFLANRSRAASLDRARRLLAAPPPTTLPSTPRMDHTPCPRCRTGVLRCTGSIEPCRHAALFDDTS